MIERKIVTQGSWVQSPPLPYQDKVAFFKYNPSLLTEGLFGAGWSHQIGSLNITYILLSYSLFACFYTTINAIIFSSNFLLPN